MRFAKTAEQLLATICAYPRCTEWALSTAVVGVILETKLSAENRTHDLNSSSIRLFNRLTTTQTTAATGFRGDVQM